MTEQINTPELRFPEFKNEWKLEKLGNLANIVRGASPRPIKDSKWFDDNSDIGWLRISDVTQQNGKIKFLQQHLSTEGQKKTRVLYEPHLLLSIAASVGKPVINYIKTGVHDGFLIFMKPKFDLYFMFNWLENFQLKWNKYGQAGSQVNLNSNLVKSQNIYIPYSYEEEEKIGTFFSKLDCQIELEEKKLEFLEQQKKGYMQKIFSQELRFKDDNGNDYPNWENENLGNLINEVNERTTSNNQYVLLSSTKNGLLSQEEYFKKQIGSKDSTGYKILRLNQLVLSPQNLWLGNININQRFDIGIVSPSYRIYNLSHQFDVNFAKDLLKSPRYIYEYAQASEQGASVVRRNLNLELFYSIKVSLPSIEEQRKIGAFLNKLDKLMRKQYNKIEVLKQRKQGLLQKMFV